MINALLGQKLGMTRIFSPENKSIPVTIISAGPCKIVQVKTVETDGYNAVQLGFGRRKIRNVSKPLLGHLLKHSIKTPPKVIKEVKVDNSQEHNPGDEVTISIFSENELVDIQGITKGRGFTGVVKRWNFGGGPRTHGQSDRLRAPGSIGSQRPQRVIKGKKMAGRYGSETVTVKNLQIIKIFPEKNLLFIKGAVPGPKNSVVVIKKTGKMVAPKIQQEVKRKK